MSNVFVKCDMCLKPTKPLLLPSLHIKSNTMNWSTCIQSHSTPNSGCGCAACHNANGPRSDKWNVSDKIKTPHISSTIEEIHSHIPNSLFHTQSYPIQLIYSLTQLKVHILHLNLQPWHWPEKNVNWQHKDHFNLFSSKNRGKVLLFKKCNTQISRQYECAITTVKRNTQVGSKYNSYTNKKLRLTINRAIPFPPAHKAFTYLIQLHKYI